MARSSPIRQLHHEAEASLVAYGPEDHPEGAVELVESFGELEIEYAAIRKHCVLMDQPNRAVLEVTGKDRIAFLQSMLTQDINAIPEKGIAHSFWLNNKGRIDADLTVIRLSDRLLMDVDIHAAERCLTTLNNFIIAEQVSLRSLQESTHRLALHGPSAVTLLASLTGIHAESMTNRAVFEETIFGVPATIFRDDATGEPGFELIIPTAAAADVYRRLIEEGRVIEDDPEVKPTPLAEKVHLKPAGWHAFNIARIEAGTALYNIDFGSESLPAETGVLEDRVSFKKGCYLGQEIVARMHARGHPKQKLVAIKFESISDESQPLPTLPVSGSPIATSPAGEAIGAVTSSALSPMLGASPIAFAQVRFAHTSPGTVLYVPAEGLEVKGVVQSELKFWPPNR